MADGNTKKEITVKRISAFKFEIEVSVGVSSTETSKVVAEEGRIDTATKSRELPVHNRISVIKRAPPSSPQIRSFQGNQVGGRRRVPYTCDKRTCEYPAGAILISDAILYRIIEILLWKVLGEECLTYWGYPTTPTYRLLWKIVYYYGCFQPGADSAPSALPQDHDCQGDVNCFMDHVGRFLELCAPTQEIKEKFGWSRLPREEILKKIYREDLLPFLRKADLTNNANILDSHRDILRLQRWQEQGFTAISWNGHERFSRLKSRFPWCLQCCRRLRKSVISC